MKSRALISSAAAAVLQHQLTTKMEPLTHEVRCWCSGDGEWSDWQPVTAKQAEYHRQHDHKQVRPITPGASHA